MELFLLTVGRLRPAFRSACDDYLTRIRRYSRVTEYEVREASRLPAAAGRAREAEALLARTPDGATLVALTREGRGWSSAELAQEVGKWRRAAGPVAFAIGGSEGLAQDVLERAQARWSLGPLTLPHELARVVVCEQLYRAFTILAGTPYHKPSTA
ncbi:MAG TPA: 23S rRNA (pseudouridine(1915)-N(3))-methyltransferase RlmH [Gemmatimonadales bacterium]|nr:23S rRNA (pseudouridine(1915)-N(3))-methyltransferase RlmH [Gemmatimonadales bacterium]